MLFQDHVSKEDQHTVDEAKMHVNAIIEINQRETRSDPIFANQDTDYQELKKTVRNRFLEENKQLLLNMRPYWNIRH